MVEKRAPHQRVRESAQERVRQTARTAVERGREIKCGRLDMPWARCAPARLARESILSGVFGPDDGLVRPRAAPRAARSSTHSKPPVVFVANHSSHIDTPAILRALPRQWRQRTAVAAAADYFYRKRWVAADRVAAVQHGARSSAAAAASDKGSTDHLHRLLDQRWNLLLYAEGTRSRDGHRGKLHSGAAVIAADHDVPIVPDHVSGTHAAMPPGRNWPKRLRAGSFLHRHPIEVRFGPPIRSLPGEHRNETMGRVQAWFDAQEGVATVPAPPVGDTAAAEDQRMAAAGSR